MTERKANKCSPLFDCRGSALALAKSNRWYKEKKEKDINGKREKYCVFSSVQSRYFVSLIRFFV